VTIRVPLLDNRRWQDLVEEGLTLIPRYAPEWTNHNASDPGITLVELLAYLTEQHLYRLDRITAAHRRAFLRLAGAWAGPAGPAAARMLLTPGPEAPVRIAEGDVLYPAASGRPGYLPAQPYDPAAAPPRFRAAHALGVTRAALAAVQSFDGRDFQDLGGLLGQYRPAYVWGQSPEGGPGLSPERQPALYLGLQPPLQLPSTSLTIWFISSKGLVADDREAQRIEEALRLARRAEAGEDPLPPGTEDMVQTAPRTVWEWFDGAAWRPVFPTDAVADGTRGLSRSGRVELPWPFPGLGERPVLAALGVVPTRLAYLRCRLAGPLPDAAPRLRRIALDAVLAEQREPAPVFPAPGSTLDDPDAAFAQAVAAWEPERIKRPPVPTYRLSGRSLRGALVPVALLGQADGRPSASFGLLHGGEGSEPRARVSGDDLGVWTAEGEDDPAWQRWDRLDDLVVARRTDAVFALAEDGRGIVFGDGERGRVPPRAAWVYAAFTSTTGPAGNVAARLAWDTKGSDAVRPGAGVSRRFVNLEAAFGGAEAETLASAEQRLAGEIAAADALESLCRQYQTTTLDGLPPAEVRATRLPPQAATPRDLERLALGLPGAAVRRARAWPGLDPDYPGLTVPGAVTLVLVPALPDRRPEPGPWLLRWARCLLELYRVIGCRLHVRGPEYQPVRLRARLAVRRAADCVRTRQDAEQAVRDFLHPLRGGPRRGGWPFGRSVFLSDLQRALRGVPDVEELTEVQLAAGGGDWGVEAVPLGPLALPDLTAAELDVREAP
jgi:hypothetical protein